MMGRVCRRVGKFTRQGCCCNAFHWWKDGLEPLLPLCFDVLCRGRCRWRTERRGRNRRLRNIQRTSGSTGRSRQPRAGRLCTEIVFPKFKIYHRIQVRWIRTPKIDSFSFAALEKKGRCEMYSELAWFEADKNFGGFSTLGATSPQVKTSGNVLTFHPVPHCPNPFPTMCATV